MNRDDLLDLIDKNKVTDVYIKNIGRLEHLSSPFPDSAILCIKLSAEDDNHLCEVEVDSSVFDDEQLCISLCKKNTSTTVLNMIEKVHFHFFYRKESVMEILKVRDLPFIILSNSFDEDIISLLIKRKVEREKELNFIGAKKLMNFIKILPDDMACSENLVFSLRDEMNYLKKHYPEVEQVNKMYEIFEIMIKKEEREEYLNQQMNNCDNSRKKDKIKKNKI